jgi:microcystin-dependent protein
MANKKITDLTLRGSIEDTLSIPTDDTIQTYRITIAQIKAWILATGNVVRATITPAEQIPTGSMMPFAGAAAALPTGWLICDGASLLRASYPALFTVIGTAHGAADGTHFNVPDLRGRFLRGLDAAQGRDPDVAGRTASKTGANTGDNVGSLQGHAFQTHTHTVTDPTHNHTQNAHSHLMGTALTGGGGADRGSQVGTTNVSTAATTPTNNAASTGITNQNAAASGTHSQTSANESRPVNIAVNYIIKY